MTKIFNNEDNNKLKENRTNSNGVLFSGLSYIKNQRNYLIINAIVPLYCIIVQVTNLLFTFSFILRVEEIPHEFNRPRNPFFLLDALTPSLLVLIFIIFSIINLIFLIRWRTKVHQYENQQQNPSTLEGNVSLTHLFYDIIDIMENLKKIFIVLNVLFVFYLQWFFRFFIDQLFRNGDWKGIPSRDLDPFHSVIMPWMNVILQLLLILYLFMNWRHFIRWNRKLVKLKDFERQIYIELDLDSELLLVYGDQEDLEEVRQLLQNRKQKFKIKAAQIIDNEEFEKRFRDIIQENDD